MSGIHTRFVSTLVLGHQSELEPLDEWTSEAVGQVKSQDVLMSRGFKAFLIFFPNPPIVLLAKEKVNFFLMAH